MNIIYKNFRIFRKIILNFSIFMVPYKFWEIPGEFYDLVEKFSKKAQKNSLDREGLLKIAWKFLNFFQKIDRNL